MDDTYKGSYDEMSPRSWTVKTKYGLSGSKTIRQSVPIINKELLMDTCKPMISTSLKPTLSRGDPSSHKSIPV